MALVWLREPRLQLPALISHLLLKREAASQHGSRHLKGGWGVQEHREAAEEGAELSDAYKHEIKAPTPLRPEGGRKA